MLKLWAKSRAFTLSETLITIGIIGVIAALTIPILSKNSTETENKTAYRKAFSDSTNIWEQMANDNEIDYCPSDWSIADRDCSYTHWENFKKHIQIEKDCQTAGVAECWDVNGEGLFEVASSGATYAPSRPAGTGARGIIDTAGRSWIMVESNYCRENIVVDTNGFKPPNKFGKDRFTLHPTNSNGTTTAGYHTKITPWQDCGHVNQYCGYPPCYGTKWLYNRRYDDEFNICFKF